MAACNARRIGCGSRCTSWTRPQVLWFGRLILIAICSDIFSIEDEIADQIADALSVRLGRLRPKPPTVTAAQYLEAYLAFLRGRTLLGRFTVAESEAAVPYFERAIALDPNFAAAYASLYDARMQAVDQRRRI